MAEEFGARFGSSTRRVVTADLCDDSAVVEAFARTAADPDLPPVGVIVLVGTGPFDGTAADAALARGRDLVWSVAATVRTVAGGWHGRSPRLWLVSRDGLPVHGEAGDPAVGGLKGLVRVLAYEHPDLRTTLVDIGTADGADEIGTIVTTMTAELGAAGRDDVVAWRGGRRYVERLTRATIAERRPDPVVRTDGSYLITGGLGGLGLVMAAWLVDRGAGRVVLNGRSQPSDGQRQALAELQARAEITYVAGDITAEGVAERLVAAAEQTGLVLRGVLHAAAVLDDGLVTALSRESLERVWAPKAAGALRLHEATAGGDLDWWVGFSSVASLLGSPGQGAYAAANAWLDALVAWRRAAKLPATSINWGQWSDVGVAQSLTMDALDPITPAEGIEALESLLGGETGQAGVARLRLDRAAAAFPEIGQLGFFAKLVEELDTSNDGGDWVGPDALRGMEPAEAAAAATARLRTRIAAIMGYGGNSAVDPNQPLTEMGMDSLMAVRIRNTVRGDFGIEPPVALLLQGASVTDLGADLVRQLGIAAPEPEEPAGGLRDRAQQRAAARQRAALRRKAGQRA
jgi:phthiocerol/phenolphthiocerol synthesis type-I polyketide synthase D